MDTNTQLVNTSRIEWLDIAKGLGVILVVLGHLWHNCLFPVVSQIIYSFHMPMFFILSGFVFKTGNSKFTRFAVSKSKRLLLPSFFFFLLGAAALLFLTDEALSSVLRQFFFVDGYCPHNAPCWYFITLFQLLVLSYFLNPDKSPGWYKGLIIALTFVLGFIVYRFELYIPFGINRTIIAMVFFTFGTLLGQVNREGKSLKQWMNIPLLVGCAVLWFVAGILLNQKVSFYQMDVGNYFLFMISSICGSILFFALCMLLQKVRIRGFLTRTADNSIIIVGTHYLVKDVFEVIAGRLVPPQTELHALLVVCFTFLLIMLYNLIGPFFKMHLPAIAGTLK